MLNCMVSANCQGVPLIKQLYEYMPFRRNVYTEYYVNFKKEIIPLEKLQTCDLLIYQKLHSSWGELSEEYLLSHVNPAATVICMPNIVNKTLWPISKGTGDLSNPYDETYVDELMKRNLTTEEILYLIRKVDFAEHYDLQALFKESIETERAKNYIGGNEICDFIEENFSKQRLFSTVNHPYGALLNKIAQMILKKLGGTNIPDCLISDISCDDDYFMPIHPSVARFFKMDFIDEYTKYPVYGNMLTYYEYIAGYVFARQNKFPLAHYFTCLASHQNKNS